MAVGVIILVYLGQSCILQNHSFIHDGHMVPDGSSDRMQLLTKSGSCWWGVWGLGLVAAKGIMHVGLCVHVDE